MNQELAWEKKFDTRAALDHFAENVFPKLFEGETKKKSAYQRVYALIRERRLEKQGKASRVKDSWIIGILQEFGGVVDGVPRYQFETITTVRIID